MTKKKVSSTQMNALRSAKDGYVQHICYRSNYPGGVNLNWYWIDIRNEKRFTEATIFALERAGLAEVERGDLKPGMEGLDNLAVAMRDGRLPSTLRLTDAGRAVLSSI